MIYLGSAEKVFRGDRVWEVGRWGSEKAVSSPYHPKTLSPYLLTPAFCLLPLAFTS
ncbi:hypothetical protein N44_03098 [Microcystis aeruginosa NIES-44]|uniref:Uncharacterized protein n=1 Tax=Microcystis aeruginosa NIES-44 TaxID=449439 RepID=A0A0A1VYH4_MICAE|nr:hypothetical protein N44_03098 [Microcystis aeruginosa NIES-44]